MARDIYGRSRHASQAYSVTSFGKSFESGPSGYGKRLQGTEPAYVLLRGLGAVGTYNLFGDITAGCVPFGFINTVAVAAATVTISLYDPNNAAFTPIVLCTAASLAATGPIAVLAPAQAPVPRDLAMRIVLAGANGANVRLLLGLIPIYADWG